MSETETEVPAVPEQEVPAETPAEEAAAPVAPAEEGSTSSEGASE